MYTMIDVLIFAWIGFCAGVIVSPVFFWLGEKIFRTKNIGHNEERSDVNEHQKQN